MTLPRRRCACGRHAAVFRVGMTSEALCDACAIARQGIEPDVALVRLRGFALFEPGAIRALAKKGAAPSSPVPIGTSSTPTRPVLPRSRDDPVDVSFSFCVFSMTSKRLPHVCDPTYRISFASDPEGRIRSIFLELDEGPREDSSLVPSRRRPSGASVDTDGARRADRSPGVLRELC